MLDHISQKNVIDANRADLWHRSRLKIALNQIQARSILNPHQSDDEHHRYRQSCRYVRTNGLLVVVDNTFLSPYIQNPFDLGADMVVHSGTKYLGGHIDALAGFVVCKDDRWLEKIRFIFKTPIV